MSVIAASPRTRRFLGRTMRAPAAFDRPGLRWLLNLLSPAPIVVLVHRGRRGCKIYRTPVEAIVTDAGRGEIVVSPMWGQDSDWYRNILARIHGLAGDPVAAVARGLPALSLRPAASGS